MYIFCCASSNPHYRGCITKQIWIDIHTEQRYKPLFLQPVSICLSNVSKIVFSVVRNHGQLKFYLQICCHDKDTGFLYDGVNKKPSTSVTCNATDVTSHQGSRAVASWHVNPGNFCSCKCSFSTISRHRSQFQQFGTTANRPHANRGRITTHPAASAFPHITKRAANICPICKCVWIYSSMHMPVSSIGNISVALCVLTW